MWMAQGSQVEPVYPPSAGNYGYGDRDIAGIGTVGGVSNTDDSRNDLTRIADPYPQVLVSAQAGDVVFFGGHVLHRSKLNFSADRTRRSFVGHYCNARSFTQWGGDPDDAGDRLFDAIDPFTGSTNGSHILARGDTHLPFARSRFGTPSASLLSADERRAHANRARTIMGDMDSDMMENMPSNPAMDHDDEK